MQIAITLEDVFYFLSPVGCPLEAVLTALLFVAIAGCGVAAI